MDIFFLTLRSTICDLFPASMSSHRVDTVCKLFARQNNLQCDGENGNNWPIHCHVRAHWLLIPLISKSFPSFSQAKNYIL